MPSMNNHSRSSRSRSRWATRFLTPLLISVLSFGSLGFGPPVLTDGNQIPVRLYPHQITEILQAKQWPAVLAKAVVVADLDTNTVLYAKESTQRLPMASTTKIMTALLALERGQLNSETTVSATAAAVGGTSMFLQTGETISLENLLYGMLLASGNDAAVAIAEHIAGSQAAFVDLMNERAAQLGLADTHFANAHGLDADGHYSSALDLFKLARVALQNPTFAAIVSTVNYNAGGHRVTNRNELLTTYRDADGVKTGTTDNAGECLVGSVNHNGHRVLVSILGSTDRYADARALLDHYHAYFDWALMRLPATDLSRARDSVGEMRFLQATDEVRVFLPKWKLPLVQPVRNFVPSENTTAGQPAGDVSYWIGSQQIVTQTMTWGEF